MKSKPAQKIKVKIRESNPIVKEVGKHKKDVRYFLRESILTDGTTINNFKNGRIPIAKYLSPMIVAFYEPEFSDPLEIDKGRL